MRNIILIFLLVSPLSAHSVSRVGGGKISSQSSNFEMNIPLDFKTSDGDSDSVRCLGPNAFAVRNGQPTPVVQTFEVAEFRREFKNEAETDKKSLERLLADSNWTNFSTAYSCALSMRMENESAIAYIVTWGAGKGFVLKGVNTPRTNQVMEEAIRSLHINGGCEWK